MFQQNQIPLIQPPLLNADRLLDDNIKQYFEKQFVWMTSQYIREQTEQQLFKQIKDFFNEIYQIKINQIQNPLEVLNILKNIFSNQTNQLNLFLDLSEEELNKFAQILQIKLIFIQPQKLQREFGSQIFQIAKIIIEKNEQTQKFSYIFGLQSLYKQNMIISQPIQKDTNKGFSTPNQFTIPQNIKSNTSQQIQPQNNQKFSTNNQIQPKFNTNNQIQPENNQKFSTNNQIQPKFNTSNQIQPENNQKFSTNNYIQPKFNTSNQIQPENNKKFSNSNQIQLKLSTSNQIQPENKQQFSTGYQASSNMNFQQQGQPFPQFQKSQAPQQLNQFNIPNICLQNDQLNYVLSTIYISDQVEEEIKKPNLKVFTNSTNNVQNNVTVCELCPEKQSENLIKLPCCTKTVHSQCVENELENSNDFLWDLKCSFCNQNYKINFLKEILGKKLEEKIKKQISNETCFNCKTQITILPEQKNQSCQINCQNCLAAICSKCRKKFHLSDSKCEDDRQEFIKSLQKDPQQIDFFQLQAN